MGSKFTPSVTATELWDARLVASYTVNQLAEQQHRLDQLVHSPSAVPPLGAWSHLTDLSNTEDMEVDPMHMDPLQAATPSHLPPTPCVLSHSSLFAAGGNSMPSYGDEGGDLASCLEGGIHGHHLHHHHHHHHQGCFQLRSGRYGRHGGPIGCSTAEVAQQPQQPQQPQQQGTTAEESAALNLDLPSECMPSWMLAYMEKSAGAGDESCWHATTQRRFAQLGHKWRVVNTWRGVKFKGTDILRQKLACAEAWKQGCPAMAMVYRREHRRSPATEESEGSEVPADKDLGEDENMVVRFAGTHNHLQQQGNIHSAQRQIANDLVEDHLPLALLDQLRGARPSCTLHPHQHPVMPPSFHQLPFSQHQHQPLFPAALPPARIPPSSTTASRAAANTVAGGGTAGSSAANNTAGGGAAMGAVGSSTPEFRAVRGATTKSNTPDCRAALCNTAVSRYTLRCMEGRRGQQLGLAACPDAFVGKVPSAHPFAAFACNEATAPLIDHIEAALKGCDPCTTTILQLWRLLQRPEVQPGLPKPPTIERVREALLCLVYKQDALSLALQHTQTQHGGCAGAASIAQQQRAEREPQPLVSQQTNHQVHPDRAAPAHTEAQPEALMQVQVEPQRLSEGQLQVYVPTQEQGQGHSQRRGVGEQQSIEQHGPTAQQQQQQQQCVALPAACLESALRRWLEQQQQQQQVPTVSTPASLAGAECVLGTSAARAATHALELLRAVLSSRSALSASSMQPQLHGLGGPPSGRSAIPEWSRLPALLKSFAEGRQQQDQHRRQGHQDREEGRQEGADPDSLQQAESLLSSLVRAEGSPEDNSGRAYWMPPPPAPGSNTHPWSMARLLPVVGLTASDPLTPWGADAHTHAPPPLPHNPQELLQQQQQQEQQQKVGKGAKPIKRKKGHAAPGNGQQEQQGEAEREQLQQQKQGEQQHGDGQQEEKKQQRAQAAEGETAEHEQQQLEGQKLRDQATKRKQQQYARKLWLELTRAGFSASAIAEWTAVALCWSAGKRGFDWPARYVHPRYGTCRSIDEVLKALRPTQQQQQEEVARRGGGSSRQQEQQQEEEQQGQEARPGARKRRLDEEGGAGAAHEEDPEGDDGDDGGAKMGAAMGPQEEGDHSSGLRQQRQPKQKHLLRQKVQQALQLEKELAEEAAQQWQRAQERRLMREPPASKHVGVLKPQALHGSVHVAPPTVLLPPTLGHPLPNMAAAAAAAAAEGAAQPQMRSGARRSTTLNCSGGTQAGATAGPPTQALTKEEPEGVQGPGSRPSFPPNSIWKRPPAASAAPSQAAAPPTHTPMRNLHPRPLSHHPIGPPHGQPLHTHPRAPPTSSQSLLPPPLMRTRLCAEPYAAGRSQPLEHQLPQHQRTQHRPQHVPSFATSLPAAAGTTQPSMPAAAQLQSAGWGAQLAVLEGRARAEVRPSVLRAASARLAAILGRSSNQCPPNSASNQCRPPALEAQPSAPQGANARLAATLGRSGNLAGSTGNQASRHHDTEPTDSPDGDLHAAAGGLHFRPGGCAGCVGGSGIAGAGSGDGGDAAVGGGDVVDSGGVAAAGAAAGHEQGGDEDGDGADDDVLGGNNYYDDAVRAGEHAGMAGSGDASVPAPPTAGTLRDACAADHHQSSGPWRKKCKADDMQQRQQRQQQQQQQQWTAQQGNTDGARLRAETASPKHKRKKHRHGIKQEGEGKG